MPSRIRNILVVFAVLLAGVTAWVVARHYKYGGHFAGQSPAAVTPIVGGFEQFTANPGFPVSTTFGNVDGKAPGPAALQRYLRLFNAEFSIYPADLIRRTQLKRVVFCEDLSYDGQRRTAVPDFEHDTLYLDVSRGAYSRLYQREVIHHEFFHIIDYRDDGEVYTDARWSALNLPTFHYGTGGKNMQNNSAAGTWTEKYPGFLDQYSTTGVEEDKAEVFAAMIVDPAYVAARIEHDPVLALKIRRMKQLVDEFCPEMNDSFWEKVRKSQPSKP